MSKVWKKSLALWPNISSQINKLLPTWSSASTSATVSTSTSFGYLHRSHQSSPLNRSESVSESVSQWVTDKHCQWSDSGPIKMLGNRRVSGIGLGWALVGCTYSLLGWVGCGINLVAPFSSSSVSRLLAPAHRHIHQAKPLGEKQATAEPLLQP